MAKKNKRRRRKKLKQEKPQGMSSKLRSYWQEKTPVLRFVLAFVAGIILFYALYGSTFVTQYITTPFTHFQAKLSSMFMNLFGQATAVEGSFLSGAGTKLNVRKGCDGLEPIVFFVLGVLLMPFSWKAKSRGVLLGLAALFILNILRITGLFLVQAYWPSAFQPLHEHGGFALFFIIAILIWMAWASWALQEQKRAPHAST